MQKQDVYSLEKDLYRIMNGYYFIYHKGNKYKVIYPTIQDKYEASQYALDYIEQNKFETSWPSQMMIDIWLNRDQIWNAEKQNILDKQEKLLESTKVLLYKEYLQVAKRKLYKSDIQRLNKEINALYTEKTSLDYLTLDYAAESIKNEYLVVRSILNAVSGAHVFDLDHINSRSMQSITSTILQHQLTGKRLREICRSEIWHSYYIDSNNTFDKPSILQNDDQRHLIKLSRMYDSVRSHPEAPSDEIIEDDDALDGWFIDQKEKADRDKKKNDVLNRLGGNKKLGDSGEIFLMAHNVQEAREIEALNDELTLKNKAKTAAIVKQKGSVSWTDLEHVRQEKLKEQGMAGYDKVGEQNK